MWHVAFHSTGKTHFLLKLLQFAAELNVALGNKIPPDGKFNLIIYMETAKGLLNLSDTCRRGQELSEGGADFVLDGIVFGSDDFCADIGKWNSHSAY